MPIRPCLPEGVVIANQQMNTWQHQIMVIKSLKKIVFSAMQAVLWQVVDATLKEIRKQYFADLDSFWDARNIYQAQLQALQVLHRLHELRPSVSCCYTCCSAHVCWPVVSKSALCYAKSVTSQLLDVADALCQGYTISPHL